MIYCLWCEVPRCMISGCRWEKSNKLDHFIVVSPFYPFLKTFSLHWFAIALIFFSSIYARLLATYGRCHDRSSLFVLAENEPTVRKLFGTNVKKYFVVFTPPAYFQFSNMFVPGGNAEIWKCPKNKLTSSHFFDKKFLICWIFAEIHSFWQLYHTYLNLWENTLFLASDAWQWLIYPSSSRPLLYGPNKISPSFMVRLTRSHLNRAFVWVALSFHTCSASESSRAYPSPDFVESIFRLYRPLSIKVVPK